MGSRSAFNGLVIVTLVLLVGSLRMTRATESLKALRTDEAVAGLALHQPLDSIAGPGISFSEFSAPNDGRSDIVLTSEAPPVLQSINPARNTHTAPLTTTISATYDQAIDAGTVTSRTFVVHGMQSGLVSSTHGVVKGNTIVVTPTNGFHQGELVYAVATTRTLNVTGTGPLSGTLWQFNAGEVRDRCVEGFTEVYTGSLTGVMRSSVAWGDYDNDGDLDILLTGDKGSWTPTAKIYQNTGSGFSEVYTGSLIGVLYGSVAWGDYDNDGDLDILLTGHDSEHQSNAEVYQNTGSGFITDTVASADLWGQYLSSVAWGDYDNDGDLDILLTGGAKHITRLYQNTSSGFSAVYTESLKGVNRSSVAWGDYDNDSDLDILLTGEVSGGNRISKVYQNTGNGFSEVYTGSLTGVREGSVAWGDYDGDGDLDILLTGEDSDWSSIAKVYQNTGSGFSEVYAGSLTSVRRYSSVAWGDYDNDGDLDILLTGSYYAKIYQNTGSGFSEVYAGSLKGVGYSSVAWGDYDNDGDLDILLTGADGSNNPIAKIYRSDDCTSNQPPTISDIANQSTEVGAAVGPISFTVSDAETDAADLILNGASSNATLAPPVNITFGGSCANRTVTVTPTMGMTGTATITITVSDGELESSDSFVLTVGINTPPAFTSTPVEMATVGLAYVYDVTATDPDAGDVLNITAPIKPGWLALADHGGGASTLSGTPETAGEYAVTLQVSDGEASDTQAFTITAAAFCVQLTEVGIAGPTEGHTDTSHTFTAVITPTDATEPITYTWSPAPDSGQRTTKASYSWATTGVKSITLTAENCGGRVEALHTIAVSAPAEGDDYEEDDTCAQASAIPTDGTIQQHTFHDQGDEDWVSFDAISGTTYLIEAQVPTGSPADVILELYDQCDVLPEETQDYTFSPGARLKFPASHGGVLYLKILHHDPTVYGSDVNYHISVRALGNESMPGALVLVAGRLKTSDQLQSNIHHVTDAVRQLFLAQDYSDDRISYLATDTQRDGVDYLVTADKLEQAITTWAPDKVGPDRPFTLYMMDHGDHDQFYLDKPSGEWVTPQEIDDWLTQLEDTAPGVRVNVIIEACKSGSFIDLPHGVSAPGRVVIASTGAWKVAWATEEGAAFSDHFITGLSQGESLFAAFQTARWATESAHYQIPWMDDDGDGIANGIRDGEEAARRGFGFAGTLPGEECEWPPYVVQATGPTSIDQGEGVIQAEVRDDESVQRVWAVIYPPSYESPEVGVEMRQENLPTIVLRDQGKDWYGATYTGFNEIGTYQIVIHAEDNDGREGRPLKIDVRTGWTVYLPLVLRIP